MKTALVVTALLLGSTVTASAGPYLGFAVGPSAGTSNEFSDSNPNYIILNGAGRSGSLVGGYRFGALPFVGSLSIEGHVGGYGLEAMHDHSDYGGRLATLTGKYNYPLGGGMEVFGRLGVNHTWITSHKESDITRSGNGYTFGVGAEYRFKLPMAQASAWVDYTLNMAELQEDGYTRTYDARMWMLGFTFGI